MDFIEARARYGVLEGAAVCRDRRLASATLDKISGGFSGGVTPVPIPNTAVKPVRPMIVPLARKSVIAGILQTGRLELSSRRLFLRASPDSNLAILP